MRRQTKTIKKLILYLRIRTSYRGKSMNEDVRRCVMMGRARQMLVRRKLRRDSRLYSMGVKLAANAIHSKAK